MEIVRKGYKYTLKGFETEKGDQTIQFIEKRVPETKNDASLITINDGTTNEEVLTMLIDRMDYLQGKFPCRENALVITKLEEALMWLEKRTTDRKNRNVEGKAVS